MRGAAMPCALLCLFISTALGELGGGALLHVPGALRGRAAQRADTSAPATPATPLPATLAPAPPPPTPAPRNATARHVQASGCYNLQNRGDCCGYVDGRQGTPMMGKCNQYGLFFEECVTDDLCVPSVEGQIFASGNFDQVCQPQKWIQATQNTHKANYAACANHLPCAIAVSGAYWDKCKSDARDQGSRSSVRIGESGKYVGTEGLVKCYNDVQASESCSREYFFHNQDAGHCYCMQSHVTGCDISNATNESGTSSYYCHMPPTHNTPKPPSPPATPRWVVPSAIAVGVAFVGAAGAVAAAKSVGCLFTPPPSPTDGQQSAAAVKEQELALSRLRKICTSRIANIGDVRLEVVEDADGVTMVCMPDKHLTHEEQKLVREKAIAELGHDAPAVQMRHLSGADAAAFTHNPYPDPAHERVRLAVRSACLSAVIDAEDTGVVGVSITDDGHYFRFAPGVRLSIAQRYVIVAKYREKLRGTARGRKTARKVNITLMDDTFDEEQLTQFTAIST